MNKKKVIILCIVGVLLLAIATGVVLKIKHDREMEALRIYNETYLVMDGVEYLRASTELDLSGKQIAEIEKVTELTGLKKLNLRGCGITAQQYDAIRAALPDCEILWSVPFQGTYYDDTIEALTVETLSEADLAVIPYFSALTAVNADQCRDYDAILLLKEQNPDLSVSYTVTIGGTDYPHTQDQLTITDPDAAELTEQLPLLPHLENVTLEGTLPDSATLVALKEAFPNITFLWNFTVCGVETNTLATFLDLSNLSVELAELEAALPCFYGLEQVDMVKCGIADEEMAALNDRHPETKFVWTVVVCGVNLRTDAKHFMPYHYGVKKVGNLYNLRYCTEIEVLDFGHKGVSDFSYLEYMPNLRFLLLLECKVTDASIIGNCTSLEYLELASTPIQDFWPLTNLTNLKNLNLSYTPFYYGPPHKFGTFGDITPLMQMTWLDRLWLAYSRLGDDGRAMLYEALPNVELLFISTGATGQGWRHSPGYYEMRDILGLWYMIG